MLSALKTLATALGQITSLISKAWRAYQERKRQRDRDALEKDPAAWFSDRFNGGRVLRHGAPTEATDADAKPDPD